MTRFFLIISVGLVFLSSNYAQAYTCSANPSMSTISPQNITVSRDLPVGALIGGQILASSEIQAFDCKSDNANPITYMTAGIESTTPPATRIGVYQIYKTNIEGIGYSLGLTACGYGPYAIRYPNNFIDVCSVNGASNKIYKSAIWFYKTAQKTGSGVVNSQIIAKYRVTVNHTDVIPSQAFVTLSPFTVTTTGCKVKNNALNIQMGKVLASNFHGVNTWPGDANTKQFSIQLDCNAGTKVDLQIDGNVQNATQGLLNLTSGSGSATGVGIQLLYNNAPLQLSKSINTGTTSSDGEYDIPLQARYYQIASNITPGTANGTATFTLTYQ